MQNKSSKPYKKAYIEITNVCNLACSFCPKTSRVAGFMQKENFLRVLDSVKPFTEHLYFHLLGEPLLHPLFDEFVSLAFEKGFLVNIVSNGILAKSLSAETLAKLRKITFSLHSYEANPITMTLDEYLSPILAIAQETKPIVELRLWNENGLDLLNEEIISKIFNFFEWQQSFGESGENRQSKNIKLKEKVFLTFGEKFDWRQTKPINFERTFSIAPDEETNTPHEENISLADKAQYGKNDDKTESDSKMKLSGNSTHCEKSSGNEDNIYCRGIVDQFGILCDGRVVPCCLDGEGALTLGNIFDETLSDILSSPTAEKLRKGFLNRARANPVCASCDYAKRFNK